jgi:hypothetical protein
MAEDVYRDEVYEFTVKFTDSLGVAETGLTLKAQLIDDLDAAITGVPEVAGVHTGDGIYKFTFPASSTKAIPATTTHVRRRVYSESGGVDRRDRVHDTSPHLRISVQYGPL